MAHKITLNTEGLGQTSSNTCWLACARMLYRWKSEDESTILSKLRNQKLEVDRFLTNGLRDEDLRPVGLTIGFTGWNAEAVLGWDMSRFVFMLQTHGPAKVGLKMSNGKHAMVLHGADEKLDRLTLANPWSEIVAGTVESHFLTLAQFREMFNPVRFSMQTWP